MIWKLFWLGFLPVVLQTARLVLCRKQKHVLTVKERGVD